VNLVTDIDGVVLLGEQPVPDAGDALRRFDGEGWNVLFVTNNSSRAAADIADRIHRIAGYPASHEQVLHSGRAAAILAGSGPAFVLGGDGIVEGLEERGVEMTTEWQAAQVVVVGLDRALTYERLRDAVLAVRSGATLVASNDDATYPTSEGQWPGAGAMVAAVERATGVTAAVAGKPHRAMVDLVVERLRPGAVWMVGDRPETDLVMAKQAGWKSVQVLTGVSATPYPEADLVAADLAELADRLASHR
jgi:4-nitrophenyl phosphatase